MEGISSNSHENYYFLGCFHSFRTETKLKNHEDLCKNNKFAKADLPEEGSNFKRYKPGAKSLKMDTVINADFKSILVPYSTCDKKHETCKKVNKQVPCGYSLNVCTYKVYIEKHQSNTVIAVKMLLVIFVKKCVILYRILLIFTNNL